jgi:hypothetical protein
MQKFLPGGERSPLPSVAETHRRASRTMFDVVSTGSTIQREGLSAARTVSHAPLQAIDETTGVDPDGVQGLVDEGFDAIESRSNSAEDRLLRTMLSTSQRTADYAEFVDDTADAVCLTGDAASN